MGNNSGHAAVRSLRLPMIRFAVVLLACHRELLDKARLQMCPLSYVVGMWHAGFSTCHIPHVLATGPKFGPSIADM